MTFKNDQLVLGNKMKTLSINKPFDEINTGEVKKVKIMFSNRQVVKRSLTEQDIILDEAITLVKGMSREQLYLAVKEKDIDAEPDYRGDTSHGLSVNWINWYCRQHNCRAWKALNEGKRRLRKASKNAKRKIK